MSSASLLKSSANGSRLFSPWTLDDVEQSIGHRFEKEVRRSPHRLAVKCGSDVWSYRDLNEQANQIAHALIAHTGSANEPVAMLYQQGAPLIAAILGALKAGKIYVPLDPHDPDARLTGILSAAQPAAILCDGTNAQRARTIGSTPVIVHTIDTKQCSTLDDEWPATPDTLAYIFFTSGSTGEPKGVVDNHRNVLHNVLRYTNNLRICDDDRLTLIQSCAFSGSVSSLFSAILNGASSFPFDLKRNGSTRLAKLINDESITMYHSVPSIFRDVARHAASFPSVRTVRLEGDRAEMLDVEIFRRHFPETCEIAIGLGATETGLSCQHICGNGKSLPASVVPIGVPAPGIGLRVVGEAGNELPVGTAGELVLRSRFLAVGYWHRPDLTDAAFTSRDNEGVREFRTGDICRINSDGLTEYLGRKDHRLKIGGNSVEPTVVEHALLATGLVREAVVASRIDRAGQSRLIAWVVPTDAATLPAADARRALAGHLPTWMIPSRIIAIASMPVSPNGKLDRKRLPDPWREAPGRVGKALPKTDLEHVVAEIWRDVLDAGEVGIDDDFFELGGDSLSATRILVAIEETLGRTFLSTDILSAPTIRELASAIENDQGTHRESAIACLQPDGDEAPVFFIHPASGDVLFYRALATAMGTQRPFYAIQSAAAYERTPDLTSLAERYIAQIKMIQPDGPYYLGGFCFGAYMALEIAHRLELRGESVAALFALDTDGEEGVVDSFRDAVAIHGRRLSRLRGLARTRYLDERIRYRLDRLRVQICSRLAHGLVRTGRGVTPRLRRAALHEAHFQACRRRIDVKWNGRVTYIQPSDRAYLDPLSFWSARASAVDVLEVPASHVELFRQPHVRSVAASINATIDVATISAFFGVL